MEKVLINAPYISQMPKWPTGCESISAVMLLRHLGPETDPDLFIKNYLPMEPMVLKDGLLYGPDPNKVFAGSPYDADSFGCYAPVMAAALDRALAGSGYHALDLTGSSTQQLIDEFLLKGVPVLYWTGIDGKATTEGPSWILTKQEEARGIKEFMWRSNEHCMLLVGADEDHLIFNDPWNDHGVIAYDRKLTEQHHHELYDMAVSVEKG